MHAEIEAAAIFANTIQKCSKGAIIISFITPDSFAETVESAPNKAPKRIDIPNTPGIKKDRYPVVLFSIKASKPAPITKSQIKGLTKADNNLPFCLNNLTKSLSITANIGLRIT